MSEMSKLDRQVQHLEEHRELFDRHAGPMTPRDYLCGFSHIPDIYERLCSDLGIEPVV